jgi:hypothetical protein
MYTVYRDKTLVITTLKTMKSMRPQVSRSDYDLLHNSVWETHNIVISRSTRDVNKTVLQEERQGRLF